MVTKKVRTEYMKKFRDPKWETFSKCYEDSLKYRLTRRVMEHSHKPWFWEGWDSGSDSSGWSTPRLTRNKVVPLSLPPPTKSEVKQRLLELRSSLEPKPPSESGDTEAGPEDGTDAENHRTSSRLDLSEIRRMANDVSLSATRTWRESNKRRSNLDRRRARSADLEKMSRQLTVADDRWMTEYMRCFSARLR
uniref:Centriole, cilia and spindle-associated protein a n=1 Tax=Sphaeramia orbicularis TaxID=375764 RepID=A0A672ZCL8_9TELE